MCDAAALELARLELTFGAQAVREEMLYPAIVAAAASRSVGLWPEVAIRNDEPTPTGRRRLPKWVDFVLLARASREEDFSTALPVEVKVAKYAGRGINLEWEQLHAESSWRMPSYLPGAKVGGCLLVVVLRIEKADAIAIAEGPCPKALMKRLPEAVRGRAPAAQSTLCGDTCSTTALAFRFSEAELERAVKNAPIKKERGARARKGAKQ
jgi:hypothetical protein